MGDSGSLTVWGKDEAPHSLLLDHLASEFCVRTEGRGRTVDEWKMAALVVDNHWLDCIVGAAVGASIVGVELFKSEKKVKQKLKLSQIQKDKKGMASSHWSPI